MHDYDHIYIVMVASDMQLNAATLYVHVHGNCMCFALTTSVYVCTLTEATAIPWATDSVCSL